ncbi:MAG: HAMP domain-containing histidine kinase [Lachnospiraceae bacterium]|nr:HAMP domain-containing histidine kinase [Lachnospiraceae bacterium]
MKELRKKTCLTILALLSVILAASLVMVNVRSYNREKDGVMRNLNILDDRGAMRRGPEGRPAPEGGKTQPPRDIENMMVMDYELYTVKLNGGQIEEIVSHGNSSEDFSAKDAAAAIIAGGAMDRQVAGNLYFADFSYRYHYPDSIVILNDSEIKGRLWELLIQSLLIFVLLEAVIVFASLKVTEWIARPAEEAFARQKEFIADASHELKTPLAVIMASADEIPESGDNRKYIENIRYESDRMSRLIAGLLNLSRLEEGGGSGHKEEDLTLILSKSCLAYEGVAFEKGVTIETDIENGMTLRCCREEIEQMAATLLDNAVRHSYSGTAVKVYAGHVKGKGTVKLSVANTGDPIPEEDAGKIFERFYRGDKARGRDDGHYGLGLAIAKRIAENHGGDIQAYSERGETVFAVTLRK